ncbi:MAG: response regulator [Opitutaceae bacterium]|nr:response regulator [Opitutaceae bacterium]
MSLPLHIVIAEDDVVTRRLVEKILRDEGHDVVALASGQEAWDHLAHHPVQVIVSDWNMPDMDGLDLCRRVRALPRETYTYFILITSASRTTPNIHAAVAAGVDDFLSKPVNPVEIWMRLHVASRILGFAGQVRQLESLIPICSYCKKVRDDANLWQGVDHYLAQQTGRDLSHCICPECYRTIVQKEIDNLRGHGI